MLFPDGGLIGIDQAVRQSRMIHDIWRDGVGNGQDPIEVGAAGSVLGTWAPQFVMYCDDTCGNGGFIDLRPGPLHGCARRWDKVEADKWELWAEGPVATSLTQLLVAVTEAIHTGQPLSGRPDQEWHPSLVDGYLSWGDPWPSADDGRS
jgi:cell wall assembly regulator SMI1